MSNNSISEFELLGGKICGASKISLMTPAFAIPVITLTENSNTKYVQLSDGNRRVVGFYPFPYELDTLNINGSDRASVSVGDPEICAIVDSDGELHIGARSDLSEVALAQVAFIESPLMRLSFLEFGGDAGSAREAVVSVMQEKVSQVGVAAAREWFCDAVVFRRVQRALLAAAASEMEINSVWALLDEVGVEFVGEGIDVSMPIELADMAASGGGQCAEVLAFTRDMLRGVARQGLSILGRSGGSRWGRGRGAATVGRVSADDPGHPESAQEPFFFSAAAHGSPHRWLREWRDYWAASPGHPVLIAAAISKVGSPSGSDIAGALLLALSEGGFKSRQPLPL